MSGSVLRSLRDRPVLAVFGIVVSYLLTEVIAGLIAGIAFRGAPGPSLLVRIAAFSLLAFVVVPRGLALPGGRTGTMGFLEAVGLWPVRRPGRLLLLTGSCYALFVASQSAGSWVHQANLGTTFAPDFSRHGLLDSRSLVAGVFEEIVFRGVLVQVLLRRYSGGRSILVSAGVFAALHLLNLLQPGIPPAWVLAQSIWAFALGALYASLLLATRSLYPAILLHYLINALVGVWFVGLDTRTLTSALYGIPFFGVLPAVLAVLWVRVFMRLQEHGPEAAVPGGAVGGSS